MDKDKDVGYMGPRPKPEIECWPGVSREWDCCGRGRWRPLGPGNVGA